MPSILFLLGDWLQKCIYLAILSQVMTAISANTANAISKPKVTGSSVITILSDAAYITATKPDITIQMATNDNCYEN